MKLNCLPILNVGMRGDSDIVPAQSKALAIIEFDRISGDTVIDSKSGKIFTITGKDFTAQYFPYKSAATLAAPVGDAELIAADVNDFWYDSSGDPNQIPVVSFFQNIDYEDKFFTKHVAQTVDGNGVEVIEPHVSVITIYGEVLTGNDLTAANTYYGVPTNTSDLVVGPDVGDDYATIALAIAAATASDTIYVKTGIYIEEIDFAKKVNLVGIGRVVGQSTSTRCAYFHVDGASIKGFWLDASNGSDNVIYLHTNAPNSVIERCYLSGAVGTKVISQREGTTTTTITDCILVSDTTSNIIDTRTKTTISGSFFGGSGVAPSVYGPAVTYTFDVSIKYCKIRRTGETVDYLFNFNTNAATIDISYNDIDIPFTESIFNGNGTYTGLVSINYNTINIDISGDYIFQLKSGLTDLDMIGNRITTTSAKHGINLPYVLTGDIDISNNYISIDSQHTAGTMMLFNGGASMLISGNALVCKDSSIGESNGIYLGVEGTGQTVAYVVEKNKIYGPEHYGLQASVGNFHSGIFCWEMTNVLVRYNYIVGCQTVGTIVIKATDLIVSTTAVYSNIIIGGHLIVKGITGVGVYNNVIDNGYDINITNGDLDESCSGVIGKNNLLIGSSDEEGTHIIILSHIEGETNLDFDYNLYYSAGGLSIASREVAGSQTFAQWQTFGQDANGDELTATEFAALFNGLATRDYSLKAGGEAIGNGVALAADYNGGLDVSTVWGDDQSLPSVVTKQRTAPWDAGAYVS